MEEISSHLVTYIHIFFPLSQKVDTTSKPVIGEGVNAPALLRPNGVAQLMDSNPSPVLTRPHATPSWSRPVSQRADIILTAMKSISVSLDLPQGFLLLSHDRYVRRSSCPPPHEYGGKIHQGRSCGCW